MASNPPARLRREDSVLLVVDVQEKLVPALHETESLVKNCATLAKAASLLDVPVVVTEQYSARLGPTVETVRAELEGAPVFEKMLFSALTDEVRSHLQSLGRYNVVLCGAETHVCVLQTALDLLEAGYAVFIVRDAVTSRRLSNVQVGLARMEASGAIPASVESTLFEWLKIAGTDDFKKLLPLIK